MLQFFHGWRRKMGVVTLVMALAVTAIWVRSVSTRDDVVFMNGEYRHQICSFNGVVYWQSFEAFGRFELFSKKLDAKSLSESLQVWEGRNHWPRWRVPYWSIALPLTLLSAYLILWKPRKRT